MRRHVRIEGAVQGVGFRWWAVQRAGEFRLRGTVRNLPDGAVDVHVEGNGDDIDRFMTALSRGPRSARVDHIRELEAGNEPLPDNFEVRY
jgi:acylphosphatase